jgi:hypothetical protein
MMRKQIVVLAIGCLLAGAASEAAVTVFNGTVNSDFGNTNNWSLQVLPFDAQDGAIKGTADFTVNYESSFSLIKVGGGSADGTLNINSGTLINRDEVRLGSAAGGDGTININSGGTLKATGTGADIFIGELGAGAGTGVGTLTVNAGGTLDAVKALEILRGELVFDAYALTGPATKDELVVDNGGTLVFKTDGATSAKINGLALAVELGAASTLDMQLGGSYDVGDEWTIVTGISGFSGVVGGDGTGVFGTVKNSLKPSDEFSVDYSGGNVTVTVIPEPATLGMFAVCGGAILFFRRRVMI